MTFLKPGAADAARGGFVERFGAEPLRIARAPGRVNLIGEHTDYNNGLVLPVALPHGTCVAARPRDDGRLHVVSAQQDDEWLGPVEHLGPGSVDGWAAYAVGVAWALREAGRDLRGADLYVDSSVPVGAGLSSSAALECAVAVALIGEPTTADRQDIVAAAVRAETEVVGAPTGGMDQTVSMLAEPGAALLVDFDEPPGPGRTRPVPLDLDGHTLLVTDTRVSHALVDGGYAERRADCEAAAAALGVDSLRQADRESVERLADERVRRRARHVVSEIERVAECVDALADGDLARVGALFAQSHASMRDDFEISCPELDVAVAVAVEAGAVGARMTGGGFGGSSVAVVPDGRVDAVAHAIDAGFALEGFAAPGHLIAIPSAGASLI